MPRRPPKTDPELQAHKEWLGYLQPRGLVVAPAAMWEAGWVLEQGGKELLERQEQFREALQPMGPDEEDNDDDQPDGFRQLERLLVEQLSWDAEALQRDAATLQAWTRELPELGETLQPTAVVPGFGGDGKPQLLIQELPPPVEGLLPAGDAVDFDRRQASGDQGWRASPQERFERLLRETEVQLGLLFNGSKLRLVVAPKGESSGHLTFTLAELAQVSGRAMFAGLRLLLGREAVLDASPGLRLVDVIEASRNYQAVVSEELADQVLAGLWQLLRGFQRADQLTEAQGALLPGKIRLSELAENVPQALYGGLITVMLRLVFLLYAEDTDLMPNEPVFEQNYKLTTLLAQLQRDAANYPDTMEQRYGAWSGICSLFRLVYLGGGPTADYLPARKGKLFKPSEYPWLETPWISDAVVLAVLSNLLIVKGERINYRALDVRQIGSVYEGVMEFAVARIAGPCIGIKSSRQGGKKPFTTAIDLAELLALPGAKRKAWLEEQSQTDLPPQGGHGPQGGHQSAGAGGGSGTTDRSAAVRRRAGRRQPGVPAHGGTAPQRQPLHARPTHPPHGGGCSAPLAGAPRPQPNARGHPGAADLRSSHGIGGVSGGALPLPGGAAGEGLGAKPTEGADAWRQRLRRGAADLRPPADSPGLPLRGGQEPVCGEPGPAQPLAGDAQQAPALHLCGSRPQGGGFSGGREHGSDRGGHGRDPAGHL
jgi:hypothetical protein